MSGTLATRLRQREHDAGECASPRPLRVLHVISGRMFGGGQRVVYDLVRTLPAVAEVDARLCLLGRRGTFFDELAPTVVPYDGRYRGPLPLRRHARALRRAVAEYQPDILHTHGPDAELIGALAVRGTGARHVSHIHDTQTWVASPRLRHRLRRAVTRWALRRAGTTFIAVAEAVKRFACENLGLDPRRVAVVRNGIDMSRFVPAERPPAGDPPAGRPLVVGTAARLAPNKGLEFLVRAAALLDRGGLPVEVRIAGDGPLGRQLAELAAELDVAGHVKLPGLVGDMPAFYRALDVFALPSLSGEGLPLTIVEAMAMRLPVVATRVMGSVEAIRDGRDGLLVPPGDAETLARALARLAGDAGLRRAMGDAGCRRATSQFTHHHMAAQVAEVYRHMTRNVPPGEACPDAQRTCQKAAM